jgi:hypothetical protein
LQLGQMGVLIVCRSFCPSAKYLAWPGLTCPPSKLVPLLSPIKLISCMHVPVLCPSPVEASPSKFVPPQVPSFTFAILFLVVTPGYGLMMNYGVAPVKLVPPSTIRVSPVNQSSPVLD